MLANRVVVQEHNHTKRPILELIRMENKMEQQKHKNKIHIRKEKGKHKMEQESAITKDLLLFFSFFKFFLYWNFSHFSGK